MRRTEAVSLSPRQSPLWQIRVVNDCIGDISDSMALDILAHSSIPIGLIDVLKHG
jgi:hypothetical protein